MLRRTGIAATLLGVMLVTSCEGPTGPEGPQGPAGPQGPPSELVVQLRTATIDGDGLARVVFPKFQVETTIVNCWLSNTGEAWLLVGTDINGPVCGAGNLADALEVVLLGGVPGWIFMATAVSNG